MMIFLAAVPPTPTIRWAENHPQSHTKLQGRGRQVLFMTDLALARRLLTKEKIDDMCVEMKNRRTTKYDLTFCSM